MQPIAPLMTMPAMGQPLGLGRPSASVGSPFQQLFQAAVRHADAMAAAANEATTHTAETGSPKLVAAQAALDNLARVSDRMLGALNEIKDLRI